MPNIDPQILGVVDDRHEAGVQRVRPVRGNLIVRPFREAQYNSSVAGGSAASLQEALFDEDETGHYTGLSITVASNAGLTAGVRVTSSFYGPAIGIALSRSPSISSPPLESISGAVDGEYFAARGLHDWLTARSLTLTDGLGIAMFADDLPDDAGLGRSHVLDLYFSGDSAGALVTRLFGIVVDSRFNQALGPYGFQWSTTLSTTATAVAKGNTLGRKARAVRKIKYYNSDSVNRTVTLKISSTIIEKWVILPGSSMSTDGRLAEYDFGVPTVLPTTITQEADANSVVQATAIVWN